MLGPGMLGRGIFRPVIDIAEAIYVASGPSGQCHNAPWPKQHLAKRTHQTRLPH